MLQIVKPLGRQWPSTVREIKVHASSEIAVVTLVTTKVLVPRTLRYATSSKVARVVNKEKDEGVEEVEKEEEVEEPLNEGRRTNKKGRKQKGRKEGRISPITAALE